MTSKEPRWIPARPVGPGDVLRQKIFVNSSVTQDELASALNVSRHTINQIVNNKRNVTAEMALRLHAVLGISARFWLNLQTDIDLYEAELKISEEVLKLKRINTLEDENDLVRDDGDFEEA